ncbi:MAG: sulfatase [Puniceicoccaceae bacterium]
MKNIFFLLLAAGCACLCATAEKPNIVLLFSDDAGYADFGFQGSDNFITPHLDKLADEGVLLTQFYVSGSTCGPSRAGMLTGRYQQRFGFEENNVPGIMSENGKQMGEEMGLPLDVPTMGNYLQDLGYKTAIFGKWHMGEADRYNPIHRGFDVFYGFRGGARSFFPYKKPPNRGRMMERGFGEFEEHEGYLTDVLADETCTFIEENKNRPFFAYVSFNAVHTPMEPDPNDADTFPQFEGNRRKVAQMALSMDRACGKIVAKLDELGLRENTLVIFTNDNGGPTDSNASSNYPLAGTKGTQLEGGIRVPGIVSWPGILPEGISYEHPMITLDFLPTFIKLGGGDPAAIGGLDGEDMLPYLKGENKERPHQTLYWKMETRGAIRDGDWKLMRFPDRPAHLFDLSKDPGEQNNLAAENPELVAELYKKLFEWELGLQRPLFLLRRQEEGWSSRRFDEFREPPSKEF